MCASWLAGYPAKSQRESEVKKSLQALLVEDEPADVHAATTARAATEPSAPNPIACLIRPSYAIRRVRATEHAHCGPRSIARILPSPGVSKPVLTVILAHADLAAQAAHLVRGALFLPEPEPLPEQFVEITLRIETPAGSDVELDARVLQVLPGHGIAVALDDLAVAKIALAPLFAEPPMEEEGATFIFWGRADRPVSVKPAVKAPSKPPSVSEPAPSAGESEAPPSAPSEEIDLDESAKLEAEIAAMNSNQKMQLAMRGSRLARTLLLKDVNKNLQPFIIQNPRITLDEVRGLAGNRQLNPDVLNTIANHKDWGNNPNIVIALVRNPKTPQATAARLVDKVPVAEVRRLAKANDVPRPVVAAARKRLDGGT
jgi:hypothetical protein